MPVRPLRPRQVGRTFLVRARLGHQWKVYPDGTPEPGPRVGDIERFMGGKGVLAYVGYVFDRNLAVPNESEGGWRPTVEPQRLPQRSEYLQALAHADLWPADEETAKTANSYALSQGLKPVKFDPTYGGELKELEDWLQECADEAIDKVANSKPVAAPATPAVSKPSVVTSASFVHTLTAKPEEKE